MSTLLRPIAFDEISYNVAILHKVLDLFGLPVGPDEVERRWAGPDTQEKVYALQSQLQIPVKDQALLVNEQLIAAVGEALTRRRLTAASRTFTVTGKVLKSDGAAKRRQRLIAFDLDLRGVAVYRTVRTLADIAAQGGFEFLGETASDSRGHYRLTFYDWMYRRTERKKADVVVYAVEDGEQEAAIVGRSRLVNSNDYAGAGVIQGLDVTILTDGRSEYDELMGALAPFLKESGTTLAEIAHSTEQLTFTADELDMDLSRLHIATAAEMLRQQEPLSHKLLYAIGRQKTVLSWAVLYRKPDAELRAAIDRSVAQGIISPVTQEGIKAFLSALRTSAAKRVLEEKNRDGESPLDAMLSIALPLQEQRQSYLQAVTSFRGKNFRAFWEEYLPAQPGFKERPELIQSLLVTQQLTLLTGRNRALMQELQVNRKVTAAEQLLDLEPAEWEELVAKTGVPDFVQGADDKERGQRYAGMMQAALNAAFPTRRIARMVEKEQLPIERKAVAGVRTFLARQTHFDFAASRVHEFEKEIEEVAGSDAAVVTSELQKLQRAFQVSPSPEAMTALLEQNLHSAYSIARIPRKSFIKTYAGALGGEQAAHAIHQRAEHIATRAESTAMHLLEYGQGGTPVTVMNTFEYTAAMEAISQQVPNYAQLFGSPDMCECEHCRSVYSASAYFVDLLRYLWRGAPNDDGKTPLDMLAERRPDLLHLPLTCENTNTTIPYVDLANEVMEYYTAHGSLADFEGYDTGEATADELRASPQHFNLEAYRTLKGAQYPFTLPYHQPLDEIRTYSDHLKVSRYEAMKAVNPMPNAATAQALAAEALQISQEEHQALTGLTYDGSADTAATYQYFGYAAASELEQMSGVREFLRRSGMAYTDLVELVKTQFINPNQGELDFLNQFVSYATVDGATLYARMGQIQAGTLDPAADPDIMAALNAYNLALGTSLTAAAFAQWVTDHLGEVRQVITLYEPEGKCSLDTTELRTIESIYEGLATSGITDSTWSKIHRFIRLWRRLGWTLHETDLMLAALGQTEITSTTITSLEAVSQLKSETKLAADQLAVAWGSIDTYGKKALYRKLFLSKGVQPQDAAFAADAWGKYLQSGTEVLGDHQSTILAALRMREEDLTAILGVAQVIDNGTPRLLDLLSDKLTIANLSTIYRYAMLAKALKAKVPDLCKIIALFGFSPFSTWDVQQERFTQIAPDLTYRFWQLANAASKAGFKASVLEYILHGTVPADSAIGLSSEKVHQTARAIRTAFAATEQDHADASSSPLTAETLTAKLALTFQSDVVSQLLAILEGTATFEAVTDANLPIAIPESLAHKYSYVKGSGRLTCTGVMTDAEQTALKALAGATASFLAAVDELYAAPAAFLSTNFSGILTDLPGAYATLLDHPAQAVAATLEERLVYLYERFMPVLKAKLRRDAITAHIAALLGLTEAAASVLIAQDVDGLIADLSADGFTASTVGVWNKQEAYIAAPASGAYTLRVDVAAAADQFKLYLDGALLLEKAAADTITSWEAVTALNAAQLHLLQLEYAGSSAALLWQTATAAPEAIPASAAYPAAMLDDFSEQAALYHRAAKFITGFGLSETELNHLLTYSADFDNIDFKALTADHWERVSDYTALRNAVPQAQALLTDVFAAANRTSPAPTVAELKALLYQATAWDQVSLDYLVDTHLSLGVADFTNEIALNRLRKVMSIVAQTGLSAETISRWGAAQTDFDTLHETAQLMKNAVKAKYELEDWLELAGDLSDTLRKHQQQALIDYLLTRPAIQAWGAKDADGLYEYFLIDVQMGTCMDSSRIVQANASIQLFVNRCLLGVESNTTSGAEVGVSPGAVDKDRWEWMKNYRVWEANRKVFLYPENWLEPDWRTDRSEFFKELEGYLVQNDITERTVEQAFRNYLTSLNEVANLDVCGIHREDDDAGELKYLHVIARTHNAPYKFFYRRWNQYGKWSAWERVSVDIRSVETTGENRENSGVQVVPVVWKNRLFLFWSEFVRVKEAPPSNASESVEELSDDAISSLEPVEVLEIRLAWSEYADGKWSPKQVSKEYVRLWPDDEHPAAEKDYLLTPIISATTQELTIWVSETYWNILCGKFILADIQSPVRAHDSSKARYVREYDYEYHFGKRARYAQLELKDDLYLEASTRHKLLPVDTYKGLDLTLEHPFFFSDAFRTYFVRPVDIQIIEGIRYPFDYPLLVPELVDDSRFNIPFDPPPIGPDDYFPVDVITPEFAGGPPTYAFRANAGKSQPIMVPATILPGMGSMTLQTRLQRDRTMVKRKMTAGEITATAIEPVYALGANVHTEQAFGGLKAWEWKGLYSVRSDTGLEFHTFYHPFSSEYVKRLNQGGLAGLVESDTAIASDEGSTFETTYDPNFAHGLVQKPADFAKRTYYKENVCFDPYGANAIYNWELFFHAPLYIATRLGQNGKYAEAMKWFHYIFDPTTDELPGTGESETSRYWKVLPFKTEPAESLEDFFRSLSPNSNASVEDATVAEWRDNPFDPHLVAANRPLAYMKHVVMKYVENLIAWGDSLFRQDTRESVYEAIQIYVLANHILGPRPETVPSRGEVQAESYESLKEKWDDFSNALVELENLFPYSSATSVSDSGAGASLLGVGSALYFCIPSNEKLQECWETVADRLYKIRHCQNIDGVERSLALFAPPIDPAALIQAASKGLSLGSILADLSSPPPIYRFSFLVQKANEFCADVKALGAALLAALEKKDAEELSRLRASHEIQMLDLMTSIRERNVLEAKAHKESLEKARETAAQRMQHYLDLLGNELSLPDVATVGSDLTADSQLPADRAIATIVTDVNDALTDSDESGLKLIDRELLDLTFSELAAEDLVISSALDVVSGFMGLIPQFDGEGTPLGVGAGAGFGGRELSWYTGSMAKMFSTTSQLWSISAAKSAKLASFIRREQEWTLQANLAAREIIQLDKQVTAAEIRVQVVEKELANHKQQIEHAQEVELFLKDKFTNQELYQWMKEQTFSVYKQSYNLAYEMAKQAEQAYKFEVGTDTASFIQYGYWDNAKQGLVAGEKLQLALRQMEKAYLAENRRELELTKSISLARLNPLALIELRETGKCEVVVPEELFDLDFRGHYFRRIKSVRLSIPCVAGPYTSVSCTLRLLQNSIRRSTALNSAGSYEHEHDEGLPLDDARFRTVMVPVKAIATSTAQNDAGMFEFSFRDDRYLPFEGAGAISTWQIELSTDEDLRQFDYATMADVVLHMSYTARENGGLFKEKATAYIKEFLQNTADLAQQPLMQMFSMRHDFPTEWHRFLHPANAGDEQVLRFTPGEERFPFFVKDRTVVVMKVEAFARSTQSTSYDLLLSYTNADDEVATSTTIAMAPSATYGELNKATIGVTDAGLDLEELDIAGEMTMKLKRSTAADYTGLVTDPAELEDVILVVHYKVS